MDPKFLINGKLEKLYWKLEKLYGKLEKLGLTPEQENEMLKPPLGKTNPKGTRTRKEGRKEGRKERE